VELVRTCHDNNALPESPQVGFAIWQAAFVCVYAAHFEHMDTRYYLHEPHDDQANTVGRNNYYDAFSVKLLREMVPRLKMARGYVKSISKMHDYFQGVKNDFYDRFKRKPLGWVGGGLEQYKMLEKELKEFGSLDDPDKNSADGSDVADPPGSRASTNEIGQGSVNGEHMQGIEGATPRSNGAWAPINAASPPLDAEDRPRHSQGPGYQHGSNHQQSASQGSNQPSLLSLNNGASAAGTNSYQAYPTQQSNASYPIPHHKLPTMGPPGSQTGANGYPDEDKNEAWITWHESISMDNSRFDNYAQDLLMEPSGLSGGISQSSPNFFEIVGPYTPTLNNAASGFTWS
jgi:hypothetical protein